MDITAVKKVRVAVIGGGAAGSMAAFSAAQSGASVILYEKNEKIGKKIYITGKGRCNVTNDSDDEEFFRRVVRGSKFLYSAIAAFPPSSTVEFFEERGIPLKTERGGRVFPLSDKSSDILKGLSQALSSQNVEVCLSQEVALGSIKSSSDTFEINGREFDRLIVACGGMSYPQTGSTGDGYKIAKAFGHKIVDCKPALVPIKLMHYGGELEGLSLKNIALSAFSGKSLLFKEQGEMLFTGEGISGPLVLSLSSRLNRLDPKSINLQIDLKPALSFELLDARLQRDFLKMKTRQLKNSLDELLPKSLISYIIKLAGIPPNKIVDYITAAERQRLLLALKELPLLMSGLDSIERGIVTSGGIELTEISPKTMESKLKSGLYFAGECLDVDAETGGFNLQIAFSTGYLAGKSAAINKFKNNE